MPLDEESKEAISHACWCFQCNCGGIPRIMNQYAPPKDVLANAWWCCYCCCGGCGLGPLASPLVGHACKYGLCKQTCETTDCLGTTTGEGLCSVLHRWFCCTCLCQCPPKQGGPLCTCCGCSPGPSCAGEVKQQIYDIWTCHLACCRTEPWWCCYAVCGGCGMNEVQQDTQFIWSSNKCCFLRTTFSSTPPYGKDGCCQIVSICCWSYNQCQIPPTRETPICACCGLGGTSMQPVGCGANAAPPRQQVMGNSDNV